MLKSLLILLCLLPMAATADTFYVEGKPQGSEVSSTVESLVKNELVIKGHTVVENKANSQWVLAPNTIKLGTTYIISLTKSRDGIVVYSDKLKSTKLDDLDIVTARLVSGALGNVSTTKNMTVDTVTDNEAKGTTVKTRVTKHTFIGFGPSRLTGLDTNNSGVMLTAGTLWGLDNQFSVRAGFTTNFATDSPADMTSISIGGQYYLNRGRHSPYAVGSIGYNWAESHDNASDNSLFRQKQSESGWGVEGGVGMHFYRTATVNIATEVTYNLGLFEVTDSNPGSLGAKLIVLW